MWPSIAIQTFRYITDEQLSGWSFSTRNVSHSHLSIEVVDSDYPMQWSSTTGQVIAKVIMLSNNHNKQQLILELATKYISYNNSYKNNKFDVLIHPILIKIQQ